MMSSIVDSSGMLMVLEIAPERNGCAAAIRGSERAIEHGQMLCLEVRRAFGGAVLINVGDDLARLFRRIAKFYHCLGNSVVDDLDQAAAHKLFIFHEREVGLDAGRVAIHHEANGAGGSKNGDLGILEAVLFA